MSAFPDYLLKLSVGFGVIALFYHLVLRQLTFFDANRHYLRFYSALCFLIPLININTFFGESPEPTRTRTFVQSVPAITRTPAPETPVFQAAVPEAPASLTAADWLMIVWAVGAAVMLVRLLLQVRSYLRIRAQAQLVSHDGVKIYHFDLKMSPFSFWNAIFYNPRLHEPGELQDMILHEYIHVRQRHSVDVIWSELICMINWFNPFAWLIRSAIRQNLEYIADQKVLENHADTKTYQYLLLKTAIGPEFALVNQFGYHSLKQRIVMMNRHASPRILLARFLFILPLLAVILAAFRTEQDQPLPKHGKRIYINIPSTPANNPRKPKDRLHLAGLLLDAETAQPLANRMLGISHDERYVKTTMTDEDGYYFVEIPIKPEKDVLHYYAAVYKDNEYQDFSVMQAYQADYAFGDGFHVTFLAKKTMPAVRFGHYGLPTKPFYDTYDPARTKAELKAYLVKNMQPHREEMALKVEFVKTHQWPKDVITLYKGGYFDRKKQLMGYEGETKLILDGREVSHREVNEAFKSYPFMLNEYQERRMYQGSPSPEIVYLTFPLYREVPPAALVRGNVEIKDISAFDPATLKAEGYMLDGFRQVHGASSNMMPEKREVKKIMLFKGRLARYYDPSLDRIWWVETRPVNEVFERPDFAAK
ncbi:hypothetical protein GCM10010967_28320 [Dyadobacter beijingensis]|uniref:Peptidase M56 domain-containing protein n=1 Tax=Dyadobacter beijingensis TaxID=365489 RepID=A0ABQ2HXC6_9BACT|nr:M56 family metallopeptidase [Dyadobacter beijingensis]GGM93502.1 hypothetical protein GCM10010967_28320 [Dyadobacter beijingensis]